MQLKKKKTWENKLQANFEEFVLWFEITTNIQPRQKWQHWAIQAAGIKFRCSISAKAMPKAMCAPVPLEEVQQPHPTTKAPKRNNMNLRKTLK